MADETKVTEKVYCYDHPSAYKQNNSAMWAALMNQKESPAEMAAMMNGGMGGMNGVWNNPLN